MDPIQPAKLVIFSDGFFERIKNEDEFGIWMELQKTFKENRYLEATKETVENNYISILDQNQFIDIQLKFYLIRVGNSGKINPSRISNIFYKHF